MVHSKQASSIAISTGSRFMSFPCVSYAQLIPFVFTETVKKKKMGKQDRQEKPSQQLA